MNLRDVVVFPERIKSTEMKGHFRAGSSVGLERSSSPKGYDETDNRKVGSSNLLRPILDLY